MNPLVVLILFPNVVLSLASVPAVARPPLFVVGCGHSGTTLVSELLSAFNDTTHFPQNSFESGLFLSDNVGKQRKTLDEWDSITAREGKAQWVEKTPKHVYQSKRIMSLRPNALFVVVFRNGIDVVASLMERGLSFAAALSRWMRDNSSALQILADYPHNSHAVCYEDFSAHADAVVSDICRFMGIRPCVKFNVLDVARTDLAARRYPAHPDWRKLPASYTPDPQKEHVLLRYLQMTRPFVPMIGFGVHLLMPDQLVRIHFAQRTLNWTLLSCRYASA